MTLRSTVVSAAILLTCSTTVLARQAPEPLRSEDRQVSEYQLSPDKLQRAEGLYRTRNVLLVIETVYGFAILVLVLSLRLSARFRSFAERTSRRRLLQAAVFVQIGRAHV